MIILVSGTNGAGKTTLVRRILDALVARDGLAELGPEGMGLCFKSTTIIGKYDGPNCGGCDTYSWRGAANDIERIAVQEVQRGNRVLLEGVIVSTWGQYRLARLKKHGLVVVHLTTPLEKCIESVNVRRRARAEEKGKPFTPVKEDNIVAKHRGLQGGLAKKTMAGITVVEADREAAFTYVRELLEC